VGLFTTRDAAVYESALWDSFVVHAGRCSTNFILFFTCIAEILKQFVPGAVDGTRWTESVVRSFFSFKSIYISADT